MTIKITTKSLSNIFPEQAKFVLMKYLQPEGYYPGKNFQHLYNFCKTLNKSSKKDKIYDESSKFWS